MVGDHRILKDELSKYEFIANYHCSPETELRSDIKGFTMKVEKFFKVSSHKRASTDSVSLHLHIHQLERIQLPKEPKTGVFG